MQSILLVASVANVMAATTTYTFEQAKADFADATKDELHSDTVVRLRGLLLRIERGDSPNPTPKSISEAELRAWKRVCANPIGTSIITFTRIVGEAVHGMPRRSSLTNVPPALVGVDASVQAALQQAIEKFNKLYTDDSVWETRWESKGIQCYTNLSSCIPTCRGDGVVNAPVALLLQMFQVAEHRIALDHYLQKVTLLQKATEQHQIVHVEYGLPIVTDRDFVMVEHWWVEADGTTKVIATSIEHPDAPVDPRKVRGNVVLGGWVLRPVDDGSRTQATSLTSSDLCGSIPGFGTHPPHPHVPHILSQLDAE